MLKLTDCKSTRSFIDKNNINRFKIGLVDFNGVLRAKYINRDKLLSGLQHSIGFCDVVIGCDVSDKLCDNMSYTGWHTGYPDAPIKILPETAKIIPIEDNTLFFLCEFAEQSQSICPRSLLRKVIAKAEEMGFYPFAAFEYEFTIFSETMHSLREKNYQNLKAMSPDNFGYSFLRSTEFWQFYHQVMDVCEKMGAPIEGFHTEIGPGVLEAALAYSNALKAADNAIIFKNMTKVIAERNDLMACFMPKWSLQHQGQSGHIHISLRDKKDNNIFYDEQNDHCMSSVMQHFVAGQMKFMPELLAMIASTINDYARLTPGFWAPTESNWSVDNRTSALRVIAGSSKAQRVEYRVASAGSNPYLALSAALLSGLIGIEQKLPLPPPITGNAYDKTVNANYVLPSTLWQAAERLKSSQLARTFFGDSFVDNFVASRLWEEREYRAQVTDWQLQRYFEII